jgi:hypothetical protein
MSSYTAYPAVVKNDDFIGVAYRRNSLSYYYSCRIGKLFSERLPDFTVSRGINRAGAVVEYYNFRLFQQRSCDA